MKVLNEDDCAVIDLAATWIEATTTLMTSPEMQEAGTYLVSRLREMIEEQPTMRRVM